MVKGATERWLRMLTAVNLMPQDAGWRLRALPGGREVL